MVFLVHLRRLVPVPPLVLLLTEDSSIQSKKCKRLKKPKRINSPRVRLDPIASLVLEKGPGLLVDLKIALRGRPQASLAWKEEAWDKDRSSESESREAIQWRRSIPCSGRSMPI
jgi:hypothetical protein